MVSLGIIEKSRRAFKMKSAFVEQKLPGQCNCDGTPGPGCSRPD